jgi:hypothetical protein
LVADIKAIRHAVGGQLSGVFWVMGATQRVVPDDTHGTGGQTAIKPKALLDRWEMVNVVHRIRS